MELMRWDILGKQLLHCFCLFDLFRSVLTSPRCCIFLVSCDNSFLAEDTRVRCRTDDNTINGHHCCKTTFRKGKARPQDFYCFLDRGTPLGNEWYCQGLADTPPVLLGLQPESPPTQAPTLLRAGQQSEEEITSMSWLKDLSSALIASLLCLYLFKNLAGTYVWAKKKRTRIYTRSISDISDNHSE